MDKKQLFTTVVLIAAAMLIYMNFVKRQGAQPATPAVASQPASQIVDTEKWEVGGQRINAEHPQRVLLGSLDPDGPYKFQAELDPRGASVYTLKLAGIYDTAEHKRVKDKTPEQLSQWSYSLLNPVADNGNEVLPLSTHRISVKGLMDVPADTGPIGWKAGEIRSDDKGQSVDFTLTLYRGDVAMVLATKTFRVEKGSHSLKVSLQLKNITPEEHKQKLELSALQYGPTGIARDDVRQDFRYVAYGQYLPSDKKIAVPKQVGANDLNNVAVDAEYVLGSNDNQQPLLWAGQGNKFFACVLYPEPANVIANGVAVETALPDLVVPTKQYAFSMFRRVILENAEARTSLLAFQSHDVALESKQSADFTYDVFCGPKSPQVFDSNLLYQKLDYRDLMQFGSCCTFAPLVRAVMSIIEIGGRALHNYGVAIMLLVVVVRLLLHPITKKSQVSMMKMAKLGPEMEKIKQKYKDDKEAQQRETMKFMKEQGATPLLGCLPMLLQTPIWIALWSGLQAEADLRHAMFIPWWLTDLSSPDALFSFGRTFYLPLMGAVSSFNLLPILLGVAMYLQQKLMPMSAAQVATTPEQKMQQKMMTVMTAGLFPLMLYNSPSGLTLYMAASIGSGVVESYVIRKHIRERAALEAAGETKVALPGKAARSKRPKKPKGPFKF